MKKITYTILFLAILVFIPLPSLAATTNYVPLEAIPGFGRPENFPEYLNAIYKFGLGAIGVSAMFMIMIGGYMYLTSAGNASRTDKAKGVIYDALAGLALALTSYLLLYTINPDLVKFQLITSPEGSTSNASKTCSLPATTPGAETTDTGRYPYYSKACPNGDAVVPNSSVVASFSGAPSDPSIRVDPKCAQLIPNAVNGVSAKILQTIAQIESTCGTNKGESEAKACGLMQLKPDTATRIHGSSITCAQLMADDSLSIEIAAKYISQSGYLNDPVKVFAGYNSGYGTDFTSEGKKPALYPSSDCPGSKAFECCENPGELKQTIDYVWKATALMSK